MEPKDPPELVKKKANSMLLSALSRKNGAATCDALKRGASVEEMKNCLGQIATEYAIRNRAPDCLAALLDAGMSPEDRDPEGMTLAMLAAQNETAHCLRELCKAGADMDRPGMGMMTPLMRACMQGRPECVQALLEMGADVHAKSQYNWTCAMWCCGGFDIQDHARCFLLLERAGANFEEKNAMGRSAGDMITPELSQAIQIERAIQEGRELDQSALGAPNAPVRRM